MRILLTGSSSFTGTWFATELAAAGHDVTATLTGLRNTYAGLRRTRIDRVAESATVVESTRFGDERFMRLCHEGPWDVLCHHAADVTNYKNPDFDVTAALANNTRHIDAVLRALTTSGCRVVVATGSVFEPGEGAGSDTLPAFSPYGLSKALTWQTLAYYAHRHAIPAAKFVIPNPFGPLEEPRFTHHLLKTWARHEPAAVNTPAYVRDNIHVTLLARAYARFVEQVAERRELAKFNPSGYIETQGAFAERFAAEMRPRLELPCELTLAHQTDFSEPRIRINTDALDPANYDWDEDHAWTAIADASGPVLDEARR
ncbi:MAG: NAD(P)-dependent oxidoreductase [Phycisphaeraceae bacterium]